MNDLWYVTYCTDRNTVGMVNKIPKTKSLKIMMEGSKKECAVYIKTIKTACGMQDKHRKNVHSSGK